MGNCVKKQSHIYSVRGLPAATSRGTKFISGSQLDYSQKEDRGSNSDSFSEKTAAVTTEVKIKVSKKQLEELLGRTDVQGLTVEQVLAQLMNVSDQFESSHQRSWRPALHSIPE